ncbi:unnamed protein product [Sphagnum balticum]
MILILATVSVKAQSLDPASASALSQTQSLLTDPAARANAASQTQRGLSADQSLQSSVGNNPQATQGAYGLAADVFSQVVNQAQGDPAKMQEALDAYSRDPASFANNGPQSSNKRYIS